MFNTRGLKLNLCRGPHENL